MNYADRCDQVLAREADRIVASCPDHGNGPGVWLVCHCPVADDMRRRAETAASPTATTVPAAVRERLAAAIRAAVCPGGCGRPETECAEDRIQVAAWQHGRMTLVEGSPEQFADVLLGLPSADVPHAPTSRAAVLREAADVADEAVSPDLPRDDRDQGRIDAAVDIRKWADHIEQDELRRLAAVPAAEEPPGAVIPGGLEKPDGEFKKTAPALNSAAGDQPENETPDAEPSGEQIVREHVTTLHLIGQQLSEVENWMWHHLADVRAAAPPAVVPQPESETPRRGDPFEAWLKAQRDRYDRTGQHEESSEFWHEFDRALDEYRLHADTGTPLDEHVCEGRVAGDCECLEKPTPQPDTPAFEAALDSETVPKASPKAETDEQRADREETERAHAAGDHEYCGPTCEVQYPSDQLRNFILAKGYPGTAGMLDELLRRAAAPPAVVPQPEGAKAAPAVVAYRSRGGRLLRCLAHAPEGDFHPVTSGDLPDGGICTYPECGADVLIPLPAKGA